MLRVQCSAETDALRRLQQVIATDDEAACAEVSHWEMLFWMQRRLARLQKTLSSPAGQAETELQRFTALLRIARDLSSVGEPWDELMRATGTVAFITKMLAQLVEGASQLDEATVDAAAALCSATIANCAGPMSRTCADLRYCFTAVNAAESGECGAEVAVWVRHGAWAGVETAAVVWPCAVALASAFTQYAAAMRHEALATSPSTAEARTLLVCELGCGLGLPTLVLCSLLKARMSASCCRNGLALCPRPRIVMSDVSPAVLDTVRVNLAANDIAACNFAASPDEAADQRCRAVVELLPYDIAAIDSAPPPCAHSVDILYASDLIYDFSLTPLAARAIASMLRRPQRRASADLPQWTVDAALRALTSLHAAAGESLVRELADARGGVALLCCMEGRDSHAVLRDDLVRAGLTIADMQTAETVQRASRQRACSALSAKTAQTAAWIRFVAELSRIAFYAVVLAPC